MHWQSSGEGCKSQLLKRDNDNKSGDNGLQANKNEVDLIVCGMAGPSCGGLNW